MRIALSFAAIALAWAGSAHAAIVAYTDQTAFLAAISNPGVDGFDGLCTNTATDSVLFDTLAGGGGVFGIGGLFFGSNISGAFAAGDVTLTAVDASGSLSQTITGATTSSFLGFVSNTGILSLTLTTVQPTTGFLWPTAENVTLGSAVPTPGAAAILGLGGLVAARGRRRQR